jgi:hypothetical protein
MNIQVADVTVHIDQDLGKNERTQIENDLRAADGVISVHNPDDRPHLMIVGYNPSTTSGEYILRAVTKHGVNAELVGL